MCDFLHASMRVPLVSVQKTMDLPALVAARHAAQPRPSWCSMFTKAFATVVAATPELRRAFLAFPFERLYQSSDIVADIAVECELADERAVVRVPIKRPDSRSLLDIDRRIALCKGDPVKELSCYR